MRQIADELAIPVASDHSGALLSAIQSELISRFAAGRRIVALIDEAHAMPPALLEQIRLLEPETSQQKLLQIVLFGQPELNTMLARRDMRQLRTGSPRTSGSIRSAQVKRPSTSTFACARRATVAEHFQPRGG